MLVTLMDFFFLLLTHLCAQDEGRESTNGFLSDVNYLRSRSPFIFSANAKTDLARFIRPPFRLRDQDKTPIMTLDPDSGGSINCHELIFSNKEGENIFFSASLSIHPQTY